MYINIAIFHSNEAAQNEIRSTSIQPDKPGSIGSITKVPDISGSTGSPTRVSEISRSNGSASRQPDTSSGSNGSTQGQPEINTDASNYSSFDNVTGEALLREAFLKLPGMVSSTDV